LAENKSKGKSQRNITRNMNSILNNIARLSRITNFSTYGMSKDLYDTERMINTLNQVSKDDEKSLKATVQGSIYNNTRISTFGLTSRTNKTNDNKRDIFDIVSSNKNIFMELKNQILMNERLYETLQDYEIFRRAIPQVSRVIDLLINSIITPEAITSEIFSLEYKFESDAKNTLAKKIKEKYDLNNKIKTIVENYLIIGTEYITVVPYRAIIDSIKQDKLNTASKSKIVRESSLIDFGKDGNKQILSESTIMDAFGDKLKEKLRNMNQDERKKALDSFNKEINKYISNIKVYKSNKKLVYDAALVEAVRDERSSYLIESSFDEMFDKVAKIKNKSQKDSASEGLIDTGSASDYDKIKINGCKIERLDPARTWPLRIKDTVVAYIYIEERRDDSIRMNLRNHFQNHFSFYRTASTEYNEHTLKMLENQIIRNIGNAVLANISPKFIEANFDNMDVFYEFLRDRQIHKEARDIIILHPDDVIEFRRQQGSIMKNSLFFLKLYLLLLLSNILTKVRRGSDRTVWYVSNGLSNDIEDSVMQAIEAIQQSQIRWSDVGTISGIVGSVGAIVDLFIPQSSEGDQPIKPEVVSGQQVEMDEPFLQFLIKSIILSFNVPSVIVDYSEEVDFAKTLSMANLDIASSSAHAQAELNGPLTKLLRYVMAYELDLTEQEMETIYATLIPSKSMLMQITNEIMNTIKDLGQSMAEINIIEDNETLRKLFVKEFVRNNLTYDWKTIDDIIGRIRELLIEQKLLDNVNKTSETSSGGEDSSSF